MRFKPRKENTFGLDVWKLVEDEFSSDRTDILHKEAVFSQGNGFIGMRGSYDEPLSDNEWDSYNACFLNGSFEYEDVLYTFRRKGLTDKHQIMLRIPDWHMIVLRVDGEVFCLPDVTRLKTERVFDMKTGVVTRCVEWKTQQGKTVSVQTKKIICLTRKNSCAIEYSVSVDQDAEIQFSTELEGDVKNLFSKIKYLSVDSLSADKNRQQMELVTARSGQRVAMASLVQINGSAEGVESTAEGTRTLSRYSQTVQSGETITVSKYVNIVLAKKDDLDAINRASVGVEKDAADGMALLETEQDNYWAEFWKNADILIDGDDAIQQGIRFCMMQLVQNSGKDGQTNIGAKGMTGYSYAGKCFWDTEIYIQPFLLNAYPEYAKALIDFRYNTLEKAREHAKFVYLKGALFPWETINGEESSFIYEAGTAQYHLQCAIGLSIKQYSAVTGDYNYVAEKGLEILMETSRCLFDVGAFIPARGNQFCMNCVCGPDEYSPMVDNNCYTNTLTMHHFDFTLQMVKKLAESAPEKLQALREKIGLTDAELADWERAKDSMYIPYSEELGIHLQDDQFLYRDPVNLEEWMQTDEYKKHEIHPLNLFRKQLLKQADVVLLMVLRSKDYSLEQKKKNYEFYEPKTINDSSLSPCAYSIVANEIGQTEQVLPYLKYTVRLDIDNYQGSGGGLHTASMGGAWLSIVQGIAGFVVQDGKLYIDPRMSKDWKRLQFNYRFNNSHVRVVLREKIIELELLEGRGFEFQLNDKSFALNETTPSLELSVT